MRGKPRGPLVLLLPLALVATGCGVDTPSPDPLGPGDALLPPAAASLAAEQASEMAVQSFRAHLSGAEEVPAVETRATGQAVFRLSKDGTELSYRLMVANIEDVMMAHIHLAPAGENGPVVVWLYPDGPPPQLIEGRFSGVLATGTITEADLVGLLSDGTMEDLVEELRSGGAYVNVHTEANPGGEIRGQIAGGT